MRCSPRSFVSAGAAATVPPPSAALSICRAAAMTSLLAASYARSSERRLRYHSPPPHQFLHMTLPVSSPNHSPSSPSIRAEDDDMLVPASAPPPPASWTVHAFPDTRAGPSRRLSSSNDEKKKHPKLRWPRMPDPHPVSRALPWPMTADCCSY